MKKMDVLLSPYSLINDDDGEKVCLLMFAMFYEAVAVSRDIMADRSRN